MHSGSKFQNQRLELTFYENNAFSVISALTSRFTLYSVFGVPIKITGDRVPFTHAKQSF